MHLLELVAMLGAAQGVLLLLFVLLRYRHRANVPLALLLLTFAVRLGTIPSWREAILLEYRWFLALTGPLPLLFGPLVWWYVHDLIRVRSSRPRLLPLHALPYLGETAALSTVLFLMSEGEYRAFVTAIFAGNPPWWMTARHLGKLASGVAYLIPSMQLAFERPVSASGCGDTVRMWPRIVVLSPFASLLAFVCVVFWPESAAGTAETAGKAGGAFPPLMIPALAMMATVYFFSLVALVSPQVLTEPNSVDVPREYTRVTEGPVDGHEPSATGVVRMSDEECGRIAGRVQRLLEAGAYQDPDLSLRLMAEELHVHPNRLSAAVNRVYGENFCRLVNRYRLEHFAELLRGGMPEQRTLLDIAFEAGFPSKSTFNRVFKERFGTPPSHYVHRLHPAPRNESVRADFRH